MPIIVDWGTVEEDVIVWKYRGKWSTDDTQKAIQNTRQMMTTKSHTIDFLVDVRYIAHARDPVGIIHDIVRCAAENRGVYILIAHSSLWHSAVNMAHQAIPGNWYADTIIATSVDNAYVILERVQQERRDGLRDGIPSVEFPLDD